MTIVHTPTAQVRSKHLITTNTTLLQQATERECNVFFVDIVSGLSDAERLHLQETGLLNDQGDVCLLTDKHVAYLSGIFTQSLRHSFVSLDASRPWMIYWCTHGLDLLLANNNNQQKAAVHTPVSTHAPRSLITLQQCWTQSHNNNGGGGFGGNVGQLPHAATTYAAVMALVVLSQYNTDTILEYLQSIRPLLYHWMQHQLIDTETGAVRMHVDGEVDVRATYCVVSVCVVLHLPIPHVENVVAFVQSCQSWEGGFGGEPGAEAHGGYTYCAVATLQLLHRHPHHPEALRDWLSRRQLSFEGGFNGRTNKLVDGCYSFWQGAASYMVGNATLMDAPMLQRYILLCGQDVNGGLRDKPSKPRDFYHTCYCLSGLSIAQQVSFSLQGEDPNKLPLLYGSPEASRVSATHPCFNVRVEHVERVQAYFADKPLSKK